MQTRAGGGAAEIRVRTGLDQLSGVRKRLPFSTTLISIMRLTGQTGKLYIFPSRFSSATVIHFVWAEGRGCRLRRGGCWARLLETSCSLEGAWPGAWEARMPCGFVLLP